MKKPNLVMMFGDDTLSLNEELSRWTQAFSQKHGDMNLEVLEGNGSVSDIKNHLLASPFLSEKRLVVLKDFQSEQKADAKKEFKEALAQLPDSTVLVMTEQGTPDKRSSLYKFLIQEATLKEFPQPEGHGLTQWIVARTRKHGGHMDPSVANALAALISTDLWQLDNEIQKLCLYADEQPITEGMLKELVQGKLEQSIFEMTDRLARKDTAGTLKLLRTLHEQGHDSPYLFAMLVRQFRLMLEMKALHEEGKHPKAIASQMKVHPFVVSKTLKYCSNFPEAQLRSALDRLLEIDRRLKTGKLHFRTREEDQYLLAMEQILLKP